MTPFSTFALLYMTAMYLELGERWTYTAFTAVTLLLVVLFVGVGITRITFLIFLAVTTSHFLLVQFPDVANHVNVAIYCNVVMMLGIAYSLARRREYPADDDCFEMLRPVLQASMILVYVLAGFHKLNTGFFDPGVSCVRDLAGDMARMARSSSQFGVPTGLVLAAVIAPAAYRLFSISPLRRYLPVLAGAAAVAGLAALLLVRLRPDVPAGTLELVVLGMAVTVILWELVGGLLLAVPRLQAPVLAFSWSMHASLALVGFVDFGALALALLFTFVPGPYRELLLGRLRVPVVGRTVSWAHAYFALCVLAGVVSGLGRRTIAGVLFNLAALVFIWPVLTEAASPAPRRPWTGVPLSGGPTPKWMLALPVVLLLHGLTPYFGLRTAGNFSMFSNLRTEGARSNHLLLAGNPLKLWHYQEDAVRVLEIDDREARIGYQYQPLEGNLLPVVEFRKLIQRWTEAGETIPITFEYRGKVHSTEDIVHHPEWRAGGWDWEMRLMDFRVIQGSGPNQCRW